MAARRVVVFVLCAAVLALPPRCRAQDVPAAGDRAEARRSLSGKLLHPDATTPWSGRALRVLEAVGPRLIAEIRTDAEGVFALPELGPGDYLVAVGGLVVPFSISAERPIRELRIVAAADLVEGEAIPLADLRPVGSPMGVTVFLIAGTLLVIGGVTAGGVALGYHAGESRVRKKLIFVPAPPVSPSAP